MMQLFLLYHQHLELVKSAMDTIEVQIIIVLVSREEDRVQLIMKDLIRIESTVVCCYISCTDKNAGTQNTSSLELRVTVCSP